MQKIPTIFKRERQGRMYLATPEANPECQWVFAGEGIATDKIDGTCCAVIRGRLYARHCLKTGKPMPDGWRHWSGDPAQRTGHGWRPVGDGPEDRWHREALEGLGDLDECTCELIGPKIQGNPYRLERHQLKVHGSTLLEGHGLVFEQAPRTFDGLRKWLEKNRTEGIVWHHPDGRMAKVKRRDFGISWPARQKTTDEH
jgi:hypothetical protein